MSERRDESNKKPGAENGVPDDWRGYLSDRPAGPSGGPGGAPPLGGGDPRDHRGRRDQDDVEEYLPPGRDDVHSEGPAPTVGRDPFARSKSEGVSFGGLVPFFVVMVLVLFGASAYLWSTQIKPKPWDVAAYGPADKSAEEVARDLFREVPHGVANFPEDILLAPLDLASLTGMGKDPRVDRKGYASRAQAIFNDIPTGEYTAINPTPQPDPQHPGLVFMEYDRRDLTTGQVERKKLWMVRVKPGWRVAGFE